MTATQTQLRRDTSANVAAATPASGEPGWDTTNKRLVVGDGTTAGGIKCVMAKDQQNQTFIAGTVGGTGDAITLTNSPVVAAYAQNQRFTFKAGAANTGAVTLNVDSLGTKNVKKMNNGALAALVANDIISGGTYDVFYDGTQFQIKGLSEGPYTSGALVYLGTRTASASATLDFTSLMSSTYDDYLFIIDNIQPATNGADFWMRTSSDNGANYDSGAGSYYYAYNELAAASSTTASNTPDGSSTDTKMFLANGVNNNSALPLSGDVKFRGVNNTSVFKSVKYSLNYFNSVSASGTGFRSLEGGGVRTDSSNALNAVRFMFNTGNIASGNIKLYGIAKS